MCRHKASARRPVKRADEARAPRRCAAGASPDTPGPRAVARTPVRLALSRVRRSGCAAPRLDCLCIASAPSHAPRGYAAPWPAKGTLRVPLRCLHRPRLRRGTGPDAALTRIRARLLQEDQAFLVFRLFRCRERSDGNEHSGSTRNAWSRPAMHLHRRPPSTEGTARCRSLSPLISTHYLTAAATTHSSALTRPRPARRCAR